MKSDYLKLFPFTSLTCLGLAIFFLFFLGVLVWVFWPQRKKVYDYIQNLPLQAE